MRNERVHKKPTELARCANVLAEVQCLTVVSRAPLLGTCRPTHRNRNGSAGVTGPQMLPSQPSRHLTDQTEKLQTGSH